MKNKIIEKQIEYGFGIDPNRTEWVLMVESKEPLSKQEYIEALKTWIEEFKNDSHDLLGDTQILGLDMTPPQGENIH